MEGRLGAPIYGMFNIEAFTDEYTTPDGVIMQGMPMNLIGPPSDDNISGFEWTGEWTVTFETFRDMGIAFMAALVLIYGLIVWEFRDFAIAGLIMSPIPCTMIGIVPGHWIMGAEFTATSMIGMIALGGIIVRQSILIVEFVKIEVAKGRPVREAAVAGAEIRMRPIIITSLTLMAGAWAIIFDPIFQGMAVSLLFGAGVATLMAVLIIPLGCISLRKRFYMEEATDSAEMVLSPKYEEIEGETIAEVSRETIDEYKTPLWMRLYSGVIALFGWIFLILRSIFIMLKMAVGAILEKFGGSGQPPSPPPATSPPSSPPPPPAPTPPAGSGTGQAATATEKSSTAARSKAASKAATVAERKTAPEPEAEKKKVTQKKDTARSSKSAVGKKEASAVKRAPAKKKAPAKKAESDNASASAKESKPAKETEKKQKAEPAGKSALTKKAPSKKTSPRSRRGIRLKVDTD